MHMHFLFSIKICMHVIVLVSNARMLYLSDLFPPSSVSVQEMTSPSWWSLRSWTSVTTTCMKRSWSFLQRLGVKRPPTPPPHLLPHLHHRLHPHRPLRHPRRPVMQWVHTGSYKKNLKKVFFPSHRSHCVLLCRVQDSDGTPCKTVKQLPGRGSGAHRDNTERNLANHRAQSHPMTTSTTGHKGSKVKKLCFASERTGLEACGRCANTGSRWTRKDRGKWI